MATMQDDEETFSRISKMIFNAKEQREVEFPQPLPRSPTACFVSSLHKKFSILLNLVRICTKYVITETFYANPFACFILTAPVQILDSSPCIKNQRFQRKAAPHFPPVGTTLLYSRPKSAKDRFDIWRQPLWLNCTSSPGQRQFPHNKLPARISLVPFTQPRTS
jgi:hypothetical protein